MFCHSDFTLHERDLHTVCPSCWARVSDKARYCHHCATPLFAESAAGEKTEYRCPVCEPSRRLLSRRLGEYSVAVLECQRCAGFWLGMDSLQAVMSFEARTDRPAINLPRDASVPITRKRRGYRPCIVCGELMTRRNLARGKSGVLVDLCGHHGVWFDADELAQLIAWTRTGGLEHLQRDLARLVGSRDEVRKRHAMDEERAKPPIAVVPTGGGRRRASGNLPDFEWLDVLATIVRSLVR